MNEKKFFKFSIVYFDGHIVNTEISAKNIFEAFGFLIRNYLFVLDEISDIKVIR